MSRKLAFYLNTRDGFMGIEFAQLSRESLKFFRPAGRLVYHQESGGTSRYADYVMEGDLGLYLVEFVSAKGEVFFRKVLNVD
jgi:hypothetical protein